MPVTIKVISGSAPEDIALRDGETARFGRDEQWADYAFPADTQMSPAHFSLTCEGDRITVRDLNSRSGSFVNGARTPMAVLKDGDKIAAGQTVFQVDCGQAETGDGGNYGSANGRLLEEMKKLDQPLYALLDAARDPQVMEILGHEAADAQSLFEGPGTEDLLTVAPYLVRLQPGTKILERLVKEGWGKSWGLYVTAPAEFQPLRQHFRQFLMVSDEKKRRLYFRFYDPRVMRVYLPSCNPEETAKLFGPVTRFWMEEDDAGMLVEFTRGGKGAQARKWHMERAREPLVVAKAGS